MRDKPTSRPSRDGAPKPPQRLDDEALAKVSGGSADPDTEQFSYLNGQPGSKLFDLLKPK
ncbi:hypothetical protein G3576_17950 [Roseomonas stagni]|uniref:Uncharacterized protein n=1 Tax=Falsiroseomonas algicola TaxID=2716930 RepID=A0A6M1LP31_9PROT|nr:hypothetical protein [Falsiroseomonas algicola]NGM21913.1 hypothetical protein [Falsiroseomonas algicola]